MGITIDSQLKFHSHSSHIVSKANCLLGTDQKIFWEYFHTNIPNTIQVTGSSYFGVWQPYLGPPLCLGPAGSIEKIQRRATRMIRPLRDLSYHARLCQLNLPSLAYRRRRGRYDLNLSNHSPTSQNFLSCLLHSFTACQYQRPQLQTIKVPLVDVVHVNPFSL